MKNFAFLFTAILLAVATFAQNPAGINYQTVIRDGDGNILPDTELNLQMTILAGAPDGEIVYRETHNVSTNAFGLVTLVIGNGTPQSGEFASIEWGKANHYLQTAIDMENSGNYQVLGTTQFLSVPYANYSGTTGGILTMNNQERNALENPPVGMQIYNSTTNCLNYFNGSDWFETCGELVVNESPTQPTNPNPPDSAIDQPVALSISWDCSDPEDDSITYDIFFGTQVTPPQIATEQSENSYYPVTLNYNTTYFWKIVAHDNRGNTTEGEMWHLTTADSLTLPPSIEMVSVDCDDFAFPLGDPNVNVFLDNFSISKYEITNDQYIDFLNDIGCPASGSYNDPTYGTVEYIDMDHSDCAIDHNGSSFYFGGSSYALTSNCPAMEITWYGANAFCLWAGGRLPTEVEWEIAAHGGKTAWNGDNTYDDQWAGTDTESQLINFAWYSASSSSKTHPVGTKNSNELGLYDMSGNVLEWCGDWYGDTFPYSNDNPTGPATGSNRILRGGNWNSNASACKVASRGSYRPDFSYSILGFRLVLP